MTISADKTLYHEWVSAWLRDVVAPIAKAAQDGKRSGLKESGVDINKFFFAEFDKHIVPAQDAENAVPHTNPSP